MTAGFLLYLLSISKVHPLPKQKKLPSLDATVLYLRQHITDFHQRRAISIKKHHVSSFLDRVKASGGGLKGIRSVLGRTWDGWIYESGDLDKENLVKRIFQEIYLGEKFSSHYHLPPLFYRDKGLYLREKLLIGKEIHSSLRKKMRLGIASGRPRFEAELALKQFRISHYFDSVVTLDECEQEERNIFLSIGRKMKLSKPHPYSILRVIEEIGLANPQCGYISEMFLFDQGRSPNTVKAFLSDVRLLNQFLPPDRGIGQVTTDDLNKFLAWMEKERDVPCSPKTLSRRITSVKSFFRWLHQFGTINPDPAEKVLQRSAISPLPQILTEDEYQAVLLASDRHRRDKKPDARPYALLSLLLATGIKKSECLGICWGWALGIVGDRAYKACPINRTSKTFVDTRGMLSNP